MPAEALRLLSLLHDVSRDAFRLADNTEEREDSIHPDHSDYLSLCESLDKCDEEPEIDDVFARDGWLTVHDKLQTLITEMDGCNKTYHGALQKAGSALGLPAGADLATRLAPVIEQQAAVVAVARDILAILQHPTRSVTSIEMWKLDDAIQKLNKGLYS